MNAGRAIVLGSLVNLTLAFSSNVSAQDVETLVMPGQVISDHADIESTCTSCHKVFDKVGQTQLCMDCHEDVADDVNAKTGFHGRQPDVQGAICASCHADHKGRDADIVGLDKDAFDHEFTDFELIGAHQDVECDDCHSNDALYREAPGDCVDCHQDDDVHENFLGSACADCHNSTEWQDASFDHDTTDYPLLGKHIEVACLDCHVDPTYQNAPNTCFGCHEKDDAHDGRSGQKCENCHNPTDWHDSSFNHARDTEFPLEGKHALLTCNDCHSENPFQDVMETDCVFCHLDDDSHEGHNGEQCDSCHNNDDWAEPTFDHDTDTDYKLVGGHREVACNDCHIEPIFEVALETTCESCHLDDDPHDGTLGTQCATCHTEVNWQDPVFFDHDLTRFPLLGKHADVECEDCHETQAFAETDDSCNSCHRDDDPHEGNFHERCAVCHNPVDWNIWLFDHDTETEFPLEGAHVDVSCESCHRSPLASIKSTDGNCGNCHRADDVHDGEFGDDCGRCHTSDSFEEVRSLQ
jgi:hypothetical protein